jgi:hypothetical protein
VLILEAKQARASAMMHDPVLAALGLSQQAGEDMMYQAPLYDPAYPCGVESTAYSEAADYAWVQAQALATAAWQLQQVASWQAQVAATYANQGFPDAAANLPASSLTPRGAATTPLETTPAKLSTSDVSTDVGSPTELGSPMAGDSEGDEDGDAVAAQALQAWLNREIEGALPANPPPPPPPGMPATKLDLHAIIFEKAKDPLSAGLLQLIKGDGKQKGQQLLNMLQNGERKAEIRTGPLTTGAHRRAAAAARTAAAKAESEEPRNEEGHRRRRARGTRGGRGGRGPH